MCNGRRFRRGGDRQRGRPRQLGLCLRAVGGQAHGHGQRWHRPIGVGRQRDRDVPVHGAGTPLLKNADVTSHTGSVAVNVTPDDGSAGTNYCGSKFPAGVYNGEHPSPSGSRCHELPRLHERRGRHRWRRHRLWLRLHDRPHRHQQQRKRLRDIQRSGSDRWGRFWATRTTRCRSSSSRSCRATTRHRH